jgi:hypothetical protein
MTKVTRDQFEVDGLVVRHMPTGARFSYGSDVVHWGQVGERLPNGEQYDREDVMLVALQILRDVAVGLE